MTISPTFYRLLAFFLISTIGGSKCEASQRAQFLNKSILKYGGVKYILNVIHLLVNRADKKTTLFSKERFLTKKGSRIT